MDTAPHFLADLALVLCVSALTTVVFQRLRQPVVLGYLLAGAIVGPHTPIPLFANESTIHALSELGVILLMFGLGLEFTLGKLARVGGTSVLIATIECSWMIWLGYTTAQFLGWTPLESLFTGALIAMSSTTIVVKAFEELGVRGRIAEIVFGDLIVEDLLAILLLAALTAVAAGRELATGALILTSGRLLAFLVLLVVAGLLVVPRLIRAVVRLRRAETTVIASVGLCFAFALLAQGTGYSVALGAFVAGSLVAESGEGETVARLVRPVRDVFATIFFVAVGMLIDPALLAQHWLAVLILAAVVIGGKFSGVSFGVFCSGAGVRTSVQAGMSLAPIGEFSFLIAGTGVAAGVVDSGLFAIAVAVSALTTFLTPWLIRASDPVAAWIDRKLPRPVQTFASLYGTWIEQLRRRPKGTQARGLGRWLALDAVVLAAIVVSFAVVGEQAAGRLSQALTLSRRAAWLALALLAAMIAVPFCMGLARSSAALARSLAAAAFPPERERADLADAPRRALAVTLELAILVAVVVPLLMLTQPFLPPLSGVVLLPGIALLFAVGLWRSATNLQAHARAGAQAIVEVLGRQLHGSASAARAGADLEQLHRLLPGLGAPAPVRVGHDWSCVGKTLAEVNLRGLTGCTVLAIVRGQDSMLVPSGHEAIEAGDLLALAGTSASIASARRLLTTGSER